MSGMLLPTSATHCPCNQSFRAEDVQYFVGVTVRRAVASLYADINGENTHIKDTLNNRPLEHMMYSNSTRG